MLAETRLGSASSVTVQLQAHLAESEYMLRTDNSTEKLESWRDKSLGCHEVKA